MVNKLNINTKNVRFDTAPDLYGLFFEDINRAADGGLYPEMIRNRAFEDSIVPKGCTTDAERKIIKTEYGWPGAFCGGEGMDDWEAKVEPTSVPGWYVENGEMELTHEDTLNPNRLAALKVKLNEGGKLTNIGFDKMAIKKASSYKFSMWARCKANTKLTLVFQNDKKEYIGEASISLRASETYNYSETILSACEDAKGVVFSLISDERSDLVIGFTSLMPMDTFKGHGLREDLAMMLKNTHSKFIRFPGGCVVEGINEQNSLKFSRTIGPVWERPSCYLMWHYRTTNGLGFHEYLQLCEDLEMDPMYVCNCGISCQARHGKGFEQDIVNEYLEEALNAIEYAVGDENTKFGAMRAAAGHPQPFALKYVEIGNENWGPEYNERYELFYKTLKEAYPEIHYIANVHVERDGLLAEIVDEHYYNTPEFFMENVDLFDDYDREGPKIFLGEYAVNGGNTIASMECALAEAAFLTGVEKNQDIVRLSAYAPLFQNANYTGWNPNLIVFDQNEVYGIPTYHMLSMMGKYRGSKVVESSMEGNLEPPHYFGLPGIMCEKEGMEFKNVKINGEPANISMEVYGEVAKLENSLTLINGSKRHRYTGKSKVWNEEFEKFIGAGPEVDNPVFWVVFGDKEIDEFEFSADMKFESDNPVTISICNHDAGTDAGCNEPRDTQWNIRSVRNQIWKLYDGKSALRAPRFFDKPLSPDEVVENSIDTSVFNNYKIIANRFGYECYINDKLIQKKVYPLHNIVYDVVTTDDKNIYVKLINVSDKEESIAINLDVDINSQYEVEYISGLSNMVNSFENKYNISSHTMIRDDASKRFEYIIPAYSLSILKLEMK